MKTLRMVFAVGASVVVVSGMAAYSNYTIWDTLPDNVPLGGPNGVGWENQEVETGCVWGQKWDLEAFLYDQNTGKLKVQGGFDMWNGVQYGSVRYYSGDIFIDIDGDAVWGNSINFDLSPNDNNYYTVANSAYKWDYAIVFGRVDPGGGVPLEGGVLNGEYKIYQLSTATDLEVFFDQNNKANPFRVYAGATQTGISGTVSQVLDNPAGYEPADIHYVLGEINLKPLREYLIRHGVVTQPDWTLHFTEGCGNDLLMGSVPGPYVPDGGVTLVLLGISLSALGFASRRSVRTH